MVSCDETVKCDKDIISLDVKKIKEMNSSLNDSLIYTVVKFVNFLRDNGYIIPTSSLISFCEMISKFDVLDKQTYIGVSKSIFCSSRLEYDSYEHLFNMFFSFNESVNLNLELNKKIKDSKKILKSIKKEYEESLNKYVTKLNEEFKVSLRELLKSNFEAYNLIEKSGLVLTEEDKSYLLDLLNNNSEFSLCDNKFFIKALLFFNKEDLIDCLLKTEVNFDEVKRVFQDIMLDNFTYSNSNELHGRATRINEILISSSEVYSKVKKNITTLNKEKELKINSFKTKLESEIQDTKDKYNSDISAIKMKLSTLNHREEFIGGFNSVIELESNGDKTISKLSKEEYTFLKYYIRLNASKFRTKLGRSMKKYKSKVFDIKKTVQESVKFNGSPVKYYYKKPSVKKYKLVCILDISGSVSKYLEILLAFFYEISSVFNGGVEFYGFVSTLMDFTDVFKNGCLDDVVESIQGYRGYSNYGKAILDFYENNYKKIDSNTIILYFGDARNNSNKSQVEILETINKKVKYSVWLNPEETEKWNNGDSIIGEYSKCVNDTYCVNTAEQLIDFLNNFSVDNSL